MAESKPNGGWRSHSAGLVRAGLGGALLLTMVRWVVKGTFSPTFIYEALGWLLFFLLPAGVCYLSVERPQGPGNSQDSGRPGASPGAG